MCQLIYLLYKVKDAIDHSDWDPDVAFGEKATLSVKKVTTRFRVD